MLRNAPTQKLPERVAVENVRKRVREPRISEVNSAKEVSCFSLPEGVYTWLLADTRPRLMQRAI